MGPLNNEDVPNPKTKNIRLHVKRVFISDDFDGELVRLIFTFYISSGSIFFSDMFHYLFAVPKILELCEGCGGLKRSPTQRFA